MSRLFDVDGIDLGHKWSADGNRRRWQALTNQDIRRTPRNLYDELDAEFSFTLDVAALPDNALCERFFMPDDNGLQQPWSGERCWMNPPYSQLEAWTEKALKESASALVVGLVPARTDLGWFHDYCLGGGAEIRFIRGRLRFGHAEAPRAGNAPFPSMIVVWR